MRIENINTNKNGKTPKALGILSGVNFNLKKVNIENRRKLENSIK